MLLEALELLRRQELRVLDSLAQAARRPQLASGLEGVERRAVGGVADGVDPDRPVRLGREPDPGSSPSRLVISTPEPSSRRAVADPSVPSMKPFR